MTGSRKVRRPSIPHWSGDFSGVAAVFRIHLAKSDMPLVLGKAGQSIHAVRLLMKLYAKDGPSISLILEEPKPAI